MDLFLNNRKTNEFDKGMSIEPQHILVAGAGLEVMREIREKIDKIEFKLTELERKINENIPEKVLTESKFVEEIQSSEDIVNKIISEVKNLNSNRPMIKIVDNGLDGNKPTIVEKRKIEKIISLLESSGKLSPLQLAHLLGLSRTRANEYLKQMENLGLVEGSLIGKEKYYRLI